MNRVTLSGRLTKDIEVRYTRNNTAIVSNSIAVKRNYKNIKGEYDTDFINIEVWGTRAEYLSKYAVKGSKVLMEGEIRTDSYEKDGKKISTFSIVVTDIELLDIPKREKKEVVEETKIETKKLSDDVFMEFNEIISQDEEPEIAF